MGVGVPAAGLGVSVTGVGILLADVVSPWQAAAQLQKGLHQPDVTLTALHGK